MNLKTKNIATKLRELSLNLVFKAKASHIASALSICDLLAVLICNEDIFYFPNPQENSRDRLILSKGHACVALYSALFLKGCFSRKDLFTFGDDFSIFMNHASHLVPGVEFSTGSLGHGLSLACGKALAAKMKGEKWHIYVIMSDGELQEGSNWEAIMFAGFHRLENITFCIDNNNLQSLRTVDETLSINPIDQKLNSFGIDCLKVNGHNHLEIYKLLKKAKSSKNPTAIILNTTKGKGVDFMENSVSWHYKSPNEEELERALNLIKINEK